MKQLVSVVVAAIVLAALVATSAVAKGASEAMITGPGLGAGITLTGENRAGADRLAQLAQDTGFYPAVFVTEPDPMRPNRPAGELGPRYTITYEMPGPEGFSHLRQDVYPYATPSPLTYVAPGQRYFEAEQTVGGWYVASVALKQDFVAVGLPESPPSTGGSRIPWTAIELAAGAMVVLAAALGAILLARRRWPGGRHATT